MSAAYQLVGLAQHYAWGGRRFIPDLMKLDNHGDSRFAEWWLGAHEEAPSIVMTPLGPQPLNYAIAHDPDAYLGEACRRLHGERLPFLLKVLDVSEPLSIQVHPDAAMAQAGFARESAAGIDLHAPERNYRDPYPKPEMMVALSPFWLLHGFRERAAIEAALEARPELRGLSPVLGGGTMTDFYRYLLLLSQAALYEILSPLILRLQNEETATDSPDDWMARVGDPARPDCGLFAFYLLNLVCLQPGQAIYQPARLPHAYLRGRNVELMANSDNVLRAGLTAKHVDAEALLEVVDCSPVTPRVIAAAGPDARLMRFELPGETWFALDRVGLLAGEEVALTASGPEMILVVAGAVTLSAAVATLQLAQGQSAYLQPGTPYRLWAGQGGTAYRARCP
ncbi:mannose-6-phosphate isomerase, class I [Paludibacterium yongneupense]|uniref:mannose-6-phosphate isomerase, class I n=1 Tax=Paludibacterium yongneupense TaxID=400061 RepID=UPI000414A432|nr:mannose-6-phosphate isomerase, class I [Paludibacterium yongneupense]